MIFADVAGLRDTSGSLIEFVNCFLSKQIFQRSSTVRFLVPLTLVQLSESRGADARSLIQTLHCICQSNLNNMMDSIQPVLTKCKPNDPELDIDVIRATLREQFEQEINSKKIQEGKANQSYDDEIEDIKDSQINSANVYYNLLNEFHKSFAQKIEIFDPLERPFEIEEVNNDGDSQMKNQAITRNQLKERIESMPGMKGEDLNLPLSNQLHILLQGMFLREQRKINSIADQYIQIAQTQGLIFNCEFNQVIKVKKYHQILFFLEKHNLTMDARQRNRRFKAFVKRTCEQIR